MKILITGICGFVGTTLVRAWLEQGKTHTFYGIDNLMRPGSERNRAVLKQRGIQVFHGDIRIPSDLDNLPHVDFVLDAAAQPSVLAGVDGKCNSRQLMEHNLGGTLNLLELCKSQRAGLILLSTSRVYSAGVLRSLPLQIEDGAYLPVVGGMLPAGLSDAGISESFSTAPPRSLYGATKVASEELALEYGATFDFPVWINRCGVLAGAGQFGHAEQGIFAFWIHSWKERRSLSYVGFGGSGHQVRDALHPADLVPLIENQLQENRDLPDRIFNVGGGVRDSISLANLSAWCERRFGPREIRQQVDNRRYDVPWLVLDCTRAEKCWNWRRNRGLREILDEIAEFADGHPDWLDITV